MYIHFHFADKIFGEKISLSLVSSRRRLDTPAAERKADPPASSTTLSV